MNYDWIWQSFAIFFIGKFILRIGGRKSISQMTITQTIVMIGIGSLLISPVANRGLVITLCSALIITLLMVISEYIEVKFDIWETVFTGKAVMVIENGAPIIKNLKKLRMSIDRLETRLRQNGVSSIEDVKYGTIEVSGQLGYELKDDKKPLTKGDITTLLADISAIKGKLGIETSPQAKAPSSNNIFEELNQKNFEGNRKEPS
jgi:uncharacterized membrane protein YcaP (DUF421 family)